jgi:hypothetical protein
MPDVPAPPPSRFTRLARTHALLSMADATLAGTLAGSIFFSLSPDAARPRVLLYLLISVAPMAVLAPLIGPTLDRLRGGRRLVIGGSAAVRALLFAVIAVTVDSLLLFPLVFAVMVVQKTTAVSRSALVPLVVNSDQELVEANSKLGTIGAISAGIVVGPAGLLATVSPWLALVPGIGLCIAAMVSARTLPADPVDASPARHHRHVHELRDPALVLAGRAMAALRVCVGFFLFHVFFWLRQDSGLFAVALVLGAASLGALSGNVVAPWWRARAREETMLLVGLGAITVTAVAVAITGGLAGAVVLGLVINHASAVGRLAFDSIVQRTVPAPEQGVAFSRYEARFQIAWVLAGVPPVLFTMPGELGFLVVGVVAAVAAVLYRSGSVSRGRVGPATARVRRARPGSAASREAHRPH